MGGRLLGGFGKSTNLEFNCDDPRRERWQNDMPSVRTSCRRRDENAKTKTKIKNKTATTNPHMGDGRVARRGSFECAYTTSWWATGGGRLFHPRNLRTRAHLLAVGAGSSSTGERARQIQNIRTYL